QLQENIYGVMVHLSVKCAKSE
ncbi:hypothetical protein NPIL_675541, partial [Nephila pilipes]